jgi:uncharacterized membrane protein
MCKVLKFLLTLLLRLMLIAGIACVLLFVVYFWNLDQKVLGWAYTMVNRIFDRKKQDIVF